MNIFKTALLTTAIMAMSVPAFALTASQSVEREIVIKQTDGSEVLQREPAELVIPGERIVYTLNFENDQTRPATDLVLTMPVPDEITYMEGSATSKRVKVLYSADGGETFTTREKSVVFNSDGSTRAAGSEDITHIQWEMLDPVLAGKGGSLSFKGYLK